MRMVIALLLLLAAGFAWLDPAWQYRAPIAANNSGSALTDYQLAVNTTNLVYNNTGLVGSWHFSEGTGTMAADSSGMGNTGTLVNGPAWVAGKSGNGLQFDGVNDYVAVGNIPSSAQGTAIAWVKPTGAYTNYQYVMGGVDASGTGGSLRYAIIAINTGNCPAGDWHTIIADGTSYQIVCSGQKYNSTNFPSGVWAQLVVSYNGSNVRFYKDGALVSTVPQTVSGAGSAQPFAIGRAGGYNGISLYFNGTIDEVRIYNRSLSAQEIQQLYSASKLRLDYGDLRFSQPYTIYETPVSISGTGTDLADYQVFVNITNPAILSHMKADGSDLRFFGMQTSSPYSQQGLPYWIESINSTLAKVWVKANVSSVGSTIYMYYGNPAAQAQSNGTATFDFFDDFGDGDYTKNPPWAVVTGGWSVVGGAMRSAAGGTGWDEVKANFTQNGTYAYSWNYRFLAGGTTNYDFDLYDSGDGDNACEAGEYYYTYWGYQDYSFDLGFGICQNGAFTALWSANGYPHTVNQWYAASVVFNATSIEVWRDGTLLTTINNASIRTGTIVSVQSYYNQAKEFDDLRVRRHSVPEPGAALGPESAKSAGNEASLSYWLENDNRAWVRVAGVPGGASTIYAYYGNPNATSASNGTDTFKLYNVSGIIGSWHFNEGTGASTADNSGYNHPGALSSATWTTTSKFGGYSIDIDQSTSSYVNLAPVLEDSVPANGTIEFWFYPQSTGANVRYMSKTSGQIDINSGGSFEIAWSGAGLTAQPSFSLSANLNSWHHFVITWGGAGIKVYIDSVQDGGSPSNTAAPALDGNDLHVGGPGRTYNEPSANVIFDEVRIYSRALSQSEISAIYSNYMQKMGTVFNVRKYASPEPALTLQAEERPPVVILSVSPQSKTTYPSYGETFTLWVYNNQTFTDNFTLSCTGICTYSENPVVTTSYQNKSVAVTITSANISGTIQYTITATSQADASNFASVSASLTVDTTKWRSQWADAYNREFRYRAPITVTNSGNATLADYQVNFTIDTATPVAAGKMRSDCGDIRLTNGTNEMPYWIESGCNASSTKIWAKVPYIPVGSSAVYAYYGNPSASPVSNATDSFAFFEDFEPISPEPLTEYDPNNYITIDRTTNKRLAYAGWARGVKAYVYKQIPPLTSWAAEWMFSVSHPGSEGALNLFMLTDSFANPPQSAAKYTGTWYYYGSYGPNRQLGIFNNAGSAFPGSAVISPGTNYYARLTVSGTISILHVYSDPARTQEVSGYPVTAPCSPAALSHLYLISSDGYSGGTQSLSGIQDSFRIRSYASPEPVALAGSEQQKGYRTLVRRCGLKQPGANVTAYSAGNATASCTADSNGICLLEMSAGTYDLLFRFPDSTTAWKNGTVFG